MINYALRELRKGWSKEPLLAGIGWLGLALSLLCGVLALMWGMKIGQGGDLSKPITFNAAIGILALTWSLLLPAAAFGRLGAGAMRWLFVFSALYAYGIETVQTLRGLDPRFPSTKGFTIDDMLGIGFGIVSFVLIGLFVALTIRFFVSKPYRSNALLTLACRYAMLSVLIACASGLTMVADESRLHGAGSMMSVHFLGFHALQTIPLAAWLLKHAGVPADRARRLVHTAGIAWLGATAMFALQAYLKLPLWEVSVPLVAGAACLVLWLCLMLSFVIQYGQRPPASVNV